jgi:hypothetical protein
MLVGELVHLHWEQAHAEVGCSTRGLTVTQKLPAPEPVPGSEEALAQEAEEKKKAGKAPSRPRTHASGGVEEDEPDTVDVDYPVAWDW